MADPMRLRVYLRGLHVADVIDAGLGDAAVAYTDQAVATGAPARLSLAMPVREQLYPAATHGTRWVRSLLPEGRALAHAVREYQVPEDDRFALLSALGRDVAGALVIVPEEHDPVGEAGAYVPLDLDELADLAARAHDIPLALDRKRDVRLSLAGMQDKFLLHRPVRSTRYYLPVGGAPSSVIVKPEPPDPDRVTSGIATNEALCLTLAARCRLPSASARVERFGEVDCLVVDRYDRRAADGEVQRLHQEDVLTALGRDPLLKYEQGNDERLPPVGGFAEARPVRSRPGPTLDEIAELLEHHLGRAALLALADIVIFNVAIGNADAHARNLSLLLHEDGLVSLAPLYDVMCTRLYDRVSDQAAQAVDGEFDLDKIGVDDVVAHAGRWELPEDRTRARLMALLMRLRDQLPAAVDLTVRRGGRREVAEQVAATIGRRVEALVGSSGT